ncbi:MAG: hypothetical protein R2873_31545 [Caldilineaceae bacterium]
MNQEWVELVGSDEVSYSLFFVHFLFIFEHLSIPLPINDFRVPSIYRDIAAEDDDFTLLELPTGWRNGKRVMGRSDVLIMMQQWYQSVHEKRRLGQYQPQPRLQVSVFRRSAPAR